MFFKARYFKTEESPENPHNPSILLSSNQLKPHKSPFCCIIQLFLCSTDRRVIEVKYRITLGRRFSSFRDVCYSLISQNRFRCQILFPRSRNIHSLFSTAIRKRNPNIFRLKIPPNENYFSSFFLTSISQNRNSFCCKNTISMKSVCATK